MKFDTHQYWKHVRALDVFFSVNHVSFDDNGRDAILHGCWCTQGVDTWFFTHQDRIKITPHEYDNWMRYEPRGRITL